MNFLVSYNLFYTAYIKKISSVMGDYNNDHFKVENHPATAQYLELMYSILSCLLYAGLPRLTSKSAALIDNIFHNQSPVESNYVSGILYTYLSDHFPILYICNGINLRAWTKVMSTLQTKWLPAAIWLQICTFSDI